MHLAWKKLPALCETHQVKFVWARGRVGNPDNERCDRLSFIALARSKLLVDEGYESRPEDGGAKAKITREGQPCRKCSTPVVKKIPPKKAKHSHTYYFEHYFYCPNRQTMPVVAEARSSFD